MLAALNNSTILKSLSADICDGSKSIVPIVNISISKQWLQYNKQNVII